jgi:hypothetical protein
MITLLVALNCFAFILLTLDALKFQEGDDYESPKFDEKTLVGKYK